MAAATPDWTACQSQLSELIDLLEAAREAALSSQASGNADRYASACSQLAQAMAQAQPALVQTLQHSPPREVLLLLQRFQTGLQSLRETTTRLEAGASRGLSTLFPAQQANAYAKLGAKGLPVAGGGRVGGHTSIKA